MFSSSKKLPKNRDLEMGIGMYFAGGVEGVYSLWASQDRVFRGGAFLYEFAEGPTGVESVRRISRISKKKQKFKKTAGEVPKSLPPGGSLAPCEGGRWGGGFERSKFLVSLREPNTHRQKGKIKKIISR